MVATCREQHIDDNTVDAAENIHEQVGPRNVHKEIELKNDEEEHSLSERTVFVSAQSSIQTADALKFRLEQEDLTMRKVSFVLREFYKNVSTESGSKAQTTNKLIQTKLANANKCLLVAGKFSFLLHILTCSYLMFIILHIHS